MKSKIRSNMQRVMLFLTLVLFVGEALAIPFRGDSERKQGYLNAVLMLLLDDGVAVNRAPVANDDEQAGLTGNPVIVDVLSNDSDDNGLDVASVNLLHADAVDGDNDGDNDQLQIPGEGSWQVNNTNGEITFTPVTGFQGDPQAVQYTVKDIEGLLSNVALAVVNYPQGSAPVAVNDAQTKRPGAIANIDVLANDTDADNDIDPATVHLLALTATDEDSDGDADRLTVSGEGVWTVDNVSGAIQFTPVANFSGDPTPISYVVRDASADLSNEAQVSIHYTPGVAPVADAGGGGLIYNDLVMLNGAASTDADVDSLNYSWSFVERPAGSNAALDDIHATAPQFVADVAGRYELSLVVNDGAEDSAAVNVVYIYLPCAIAPQHYQLDPANLPAVGDPSSNYFPGTAGFVGEILGLEPISNSFLEALFIDLDRNGFGDLIIRTPGQAQFEVWLSDAGGNLSAPVAYSMGAVGLVAITGGNLIAAGLPDIVVADADGNVGFFEGTGAGLLSLRAGLSFNQTGGVQRLSVADLDGNNSDELILSTAGLVSIYTPDNSSDTHPLISNGGFDQQLSFWAVDIVGHASGDTPGTVQGNAGRAVLSENSSFRTSLTQNFVVPAGAVSLAFDLPEVSLDDPQGGIADAFEVSLLGAGNVSVVPVVDAGASSFLNINPGAAITLATGVSQVGNRYTVDITGVAEGTVVTLYFDLIGNPPGEGSRVVIDNIDAGLVVTPLASLNRLDLSGTFTSIQSVGACDINGDAELDILVRDPGGAGLLIYQPDQGGGFSRGQTISLDGI